MTGMKRASDQRRRSALRGEVVCGEAGIKVVGGGAIMENPFWLLHWQL